MEFDELSLGLQQAAQGKAAVSALEQQIANAEALRNRDQPKINEYGTVSPLAVIADVMGKSRARQQLRETRPQLEKARNTVAQNENANVLYQAMEREKARKLDAERYASEQATEAEKTAYDRATISDHTTYYRADGTPVNVAFDAQGNPVNPNTGEPMSLEGLSPDNPLGGEGGSGSDGYSATAETEGRLNINTLGKVDRILALTNGFDEDTRKRLNSSSKRLTDLVAQGTGGVLGGDKLRAFIREEREKDPVVRDYFQQLAALSSVERHALFGGALSAREAQSADEFIASVLTTSLDDQLMRVNRGREASETAIRTIDLTSGGTRFGDALKNSGFTTLYPVEAEVDAQEVKNDLTFKDPVWETLYHKWKADQPAKPTP